MDTKKLRQKILDLAIRGKLVPQDPNDEPASVLLERIRAEKERLIAEGKIKRPKKSKASSSESHYLKFEPPFEIPASWEWVRLEEIANVGTGATPSKGNKKYYGGNINWVSSSVTSKQFVYEPTDHITDLAIKETNCVIYPIGTLIMAMYGEGKTRGQLTELKIEAATNQACAAVQPLNKGTKEFIKLYLLANYYHLRQLAEGGNQPNLNIGKICGLYLPFPSLKEQSRIVNEYSKFDKVINSIDNSQCVLLDIIANTKSKILDLAMQGKLVPQNPDDEPAAEMLRRINPKAKIITDTPHYPQVPNNWVIVKLSDLADLLSGRDMINEDCNDVNEGIPYLIGASNIINGKFEFVRWTSRPQVISTNNDILLSCKGTIGEIILNDCGEIHIARQFMAIRCGAAILPKFLMAVLMAQLSFIRKKANGIIPGISRQVLLELEIPLPPIEEQSNILKKLQMIEDELKSIQEYLN